MSGSFVWLIDLDRGCLTFTSADRRLRPAAGTLESRRPDSDPCLTSSDVCVSAKFEVSESDKFRFSYQRTC